LIGHKTYLRRNKSYTHKTSGFKTSGLQNVWFQNVRFQNVRFTKRQVYKTSGFKTSGFKIWYTWRFETWRFVGVPNKSLCERIEIKFILVNFLATGSGSASKYGSRSRRTRSMRIRIHNTEKTIRYNIVNWHSWQHTVTNYFCKYKWNFFAKLSSFWPPFWVMWLKFLPIGNLPGSVEVEQLLGLPVPLLHNAQALTALRPSHFFTTAARESSRDGHSGRSGTWLQYKQHELLREEIKRSCLFNCH
jgi:hypothetical protein